MSLFSDLFKAALGSASAKTIITNLNLPFAAQNAYTTLQDRVAALEALNVATIAISSAQAKAEGNSGTTAFTFTLTLDRRGSTATVPYTWSTAPFSSNPANGADFVGGVFPSGSGSFAPGETTKSIVINVAGDSTFEPDEGFQLTVVGPNTVTTSGTITNDDVQYMDLSLYGVTDWTPEVQVRRVSAGQYVPSLEYADVKAAWLAQTTVRDYYTDPAATGGNGASGTPYTSISNAWTQAPTEATIRIKAKGDDKGVLWGPRGTTGSVTPVRNIILEEVNGGELIIFNTPYSSRPAITNNGDGTYSMQSGTASTSATGAPSDWSPATRAEHTDGLGRTFNYTSGSAALDASGRAALQPGQGYKQTGIGANAGELDFTFRPFGNRALSTFDGYICPPTTNAAGLLLRADDAGQGDSPRYFLDKVYIAGGTPLTFQNRRSTTGGLPRLYLNRCGSVGSGANAMPIVGRALVTNYDCKFDTAWADALNTHNGVSQNAGWVTGEPWIVNIRPTVSSTGRSNSGTDNNETGHETNRALTVMPTYRGGNGRTYAFIDNAKGVVFGGTIGASVRNTAANYFEAVHSANNAALTLVETSITVGIGTYDINTDTGTVTCYGMAQGALRVNGNVTFSASLPGF